MQNNKFKNKFLEIYRNKIEPLTQQAEQIRSQASLKSFSISFGVTLLYSLPVLVALLIFGNLYIGVIIEDPLNIFNYLFLLPMLFFSGVISRVIYLKVQDYSFFAKNEQYKSFFKFLILNDKILAELNMRRLGGMIIPPLEQLKSINNTKFQNIAEELMQTDEISNSPYEYISLLRKSALFDDSENIDFDDSYQGEYNNVQYALFDLRIKSMCGFNLFFPTQKVCTIIFNLKDSVENTTVIKSKTFKGLLKNISSFMHDQDSLFPFVFPLLFISIVISYVVFFTNALQQLSQKDILFDFYFGFMGFLSIITAIISLIYIVSHIIKNVLKIIKKDMQLMNLEDLKFNNMYITSTNNQVEGRYRVTPAFMERLMKLKTSFVAKNISASFYNDALIVRLDTQKNLFEIGDLWHSLTDRKYAEDFYNEMSSILRMIEYFKLDEKTGF